MTQPKARPVAEGEADSANRVLLLVWTGESIPGGLGDGPWEAVFALAPTLHLVTSNAGRSPVYHAAKDLLPAGAAVVVASLKEAPKAKAVAPGLAAWLRAYA